jgi:hypothetical protein
MKQRWNVTRRKTQGERFLKMAGVPDVEAAQVLWKDPSIAVHRRCLAARAIGLLGAHEASWRLDGVDDDSPLGRVLRHATMDTWRRHLGEARERDREEASQKMRHLGASSLPEVIAILQDQSESTERRVDAASVLCGQKYRDAVVPLTNALAEGQPEL